KTLTLPCEGLPNPSICRNNVVLPLPEPPTSVNTSDRYAVRLMSSCTILSPKRVCNPITSMTGEVVVVISAFFKNYEWQAVMLDVYNVVSKILDSTISLGHS